MSDRKDEIRRPWTGCWDIPDRKVSYVRIVMFLMLPRVILDYIGEIGGLRRWRSGNNGNKLGINVRKVPINQGLGGNLPKM